ncbi:hypothetical protein C8R45DRAFT_1160190 [Mycena sanguinolenta]|nr:hypothetical protein C8R45DRAFT_1160190 [Mycena sanguinolenta]
MLSLRFPPSSLCQYLQLWATEVEILLNSAHAALNSARMAFAATERPSHRSLFLTWSPRTLVLLLAWLGYLGLVTWIRLSQTQALARYCTFATYDRLFREDAVALAMDWAAGAGVSMTSTRPFAPRSNSFRLHSRYPQHPAFADRPPALSPSTIATPDGLRLHSHHTPDSMLSSHSTPTASVLDLRVPVPSLARRSMWRPRLFLLFLPSEDAADVRMPAFLLPSQTWLFTDLDITSPSLSFTLIGTRHPDSIGVSLLRSTARDDTVSRSSVTVARFSQSCLFLALSSSKPPRSEPYPQYRWRRFAAAMEIH